MAGALHSQSDTCNATTMHPREGRGHLPPGLGGLTATSSLPSPAHLVDGALGGAAQLQALPQAAAGLLTVAQGGLAPILFAQQGTDSSERVQGSTGKGLPERWRGHGHCRALAVHGSALPQHTPNVFSEAVPVQGRGEHAIRCHPCPRCPALTQSSAVPGAWSPPAGRGAQPPPHPPAASG